MKWWKLILYPHNEIKPFVMLLHVGDVVTCRDKRHIRYNSITIHYKIVYYNFCVRQAKKKKIVFSGTNILCQML